MKISVKLVSNEGIEMEFRTLGEAAKFLNVARQTLSVNLDKDKEIKNTGWRAFSLEYRKPSKISMKTEDYNKAKEEGTLYTYYIYNDETGEVFSSFNASECARHIGVTASTIRSHVDDSLYIKNTHWTVWSADPVKTNNLVHIGSGFYISVKNFKQWQREKVHIATDFHIIKQKKDMERLRYLLTLPECKVDKYLADWISIVADDDVEFRMHRFDVAIGFVASDPRWVLQFSARSVEGERYGKDSVGFWKESD